MFVKPAMEIVKFDFEDVIAESTGNPCPGDTGYGDVCGGATGHEYCSYSSGCLEDV